eukprot:CAMPEP_0196576112 /NCGR_PEP_ID=MMETSP1081-20130531/5456_1 /TAXON_ID=36882 /ORGANISM="Pyramimonas amylifera, Strain CCMP720" /LENGTH=72 /DNA_ID=CAMNT_0041894637 /DNA_START=1068 /DNA_END=1286 /DNA_ORIENTATION=-
MEESRNSVDEKQNKTLVIGMPDTVIYPSAMVVHTENTRIAYSTVMSPGRFVSFALLAVPSSSLTFPFDLKNL